MSVGPMLVDRSARMRMIFSGDAAKATLGGLVSNDVVALTAGGGQRAVALTPKGRVIALLRVIDRGTDLLVDTDAAAAEGFIAMIRKYVNPRLAKFAVVTAETSCLGVYGESEAVVALVARATGADTRALASLESHGALTCGDGADAVHVIRSADLAPGGFDIVGSTSRIADVRSTLEGAGAAVATDERAEIARIEAGVPAWGREMDAETIPQEAMLDELGAISFNKGCYTGQEIVARVHFRGHVNKHLRWLTSEAALREGARVFDAEGKEVGDVRSSVRSPTRGPLAIAMLRREVELGSEVRVRFAETELVARVARMGDAVPAAR